MISNVGVLSRVCGGLFDLLDDNPNPLLHAAIMFHFIEIQYSTEKMPEYKIV